ncbi:MAG: adenylate/guanylate cyclase domain-containing protein [Deltaproteobacteria bacterium]|nr:adenylate/guanylate cyclase domain-containing protein [Candidatus Zymogenaceae bacterium]
MFKDISIKSVPTSFTTLPAGVPADHIRFYVLTNYFYPAAILVHLAFVPLFWFLGMELLSLYNVVSVVLYGACLFLNLNGRIKAATLLLFIEASVFIVLATLALGWDSNFHYYLIMLAMFMFLTPWHDFLKILSTALIFCLYGWLYLKTSHAPFGADLPRGVLTAFSYANIIGIFSGVCFVSYYYHVAAARAEESLSREYQRSEDLLHSILPEPIARRLKETPGTIADGFLEASILFADIVDFTPLSEKLDPSRLIELLNDVFSRFDDLADRYDLEKIKTIGDAYMVVSGIPRTRDDHAQAIAHMALDMIDIMGEFNGYLEKPLTLRIGIHCGPVVAGVIGKKKFIYDLWGDSVNTAARMESHGIGGEIQVSDRMYMRLRDSFVLEERGNIDIKGKGSIKTYFLKERKS